MQLHIGIDDTDSTSGGCTTYVAARIVEVLAKQGTRFADYPNIIRLNPNIPYKTRGNAAVALRLELQKNRYGPIVQTVLGVVEKESRLGEENTDPGVVFLKGRITKSIRELARRALRELVPIKDALDTIKDSGAEAASYGSNMGLVGALAAIGHTLNRDHTFEFIAYRRRVNCGTRRRVDEESVKKMNRLTIPLTFNSYDDRNKRILITPHGPDPVLVGIRGETPEIVRSAFQMLNIREPIERWVIFRTNQATDAHLEAPRPREIKSNIALVLSGNVIERPKRTQGGHVFFTIQTRLGEVTCAAYEPTGSFRDIVSQLLPGDQVTAFGGIPGRYELTFNLEKLSIGKLKNWVVTQNPLCPRCGKRLKSAGKRKGFKCTRCATPFRNGKKIQVVKTRTLRPGLYLPELKAQRHLTKPLCRYNHEKVWDGKSPSEGWHSP